MSTVQSHFDDWTDSLEITRDSDEFLPCGHGPECADSRGECVFCSLERDLRSELAMRNELTDGPGGGQ